MLRLSLKEKKVYLLYIIFSFSFFFWFCFIFNVNEGHVEDLKEWKKNNKCYVNETLGESAMNECARIKKKNNKISENNIIWCDYNGISKRAIKQKQIDIWPLLQTSHSQSDIHNEKLTGKIRD